MLVETRREQFPIRGREVQVALPETDRQNGTTSIVYGNPFYGHLARSAACPARRVRKVLRWPLLSNEFVIRRDQPLQVAFDISPVTEWNLIETTNQKLQSADLYPSGFTTRSLYSGYTFDCNRGISRLACTWI
jgi:hypothetical protein